MLLVIKRTKSLVFILLLFFACSGTEESKFGSIKPDCGPRALLFVCESMGIETSYNELCELTGYSVNKGTSMYDLFEAAKRKGLHPRALKTDLGNICGKKNPSIVFIDGNHFMVFLKCQDNDVVIVNPPESPDLLSKKEFSRRWNGEAMLFSASQEEDEAKPVSPANLHSGPDIVFEGTSHYLGVVEEGTVCKHLFSFKNAGRDTLKILAVRSKCSCLDALPSDNTIPPGGHGEIELEFNTFGKPRGLNKQSVAVKTNDPEDQYVLLTMEAIIQTKIKVIPDKIYLDDLRPREAITRTLIVKDSGYGTLAVKSVDTPETIKAEIRPTIVDTLGAMMVPIDLAITPGNNPGFFEHIVSIHTNASQQPTIDVPIQGKVLSDLQAFPQQLSFGEVRRNDSIKRSITISSKMTANFEVTDIRSPSCISTTMQRSDDGAYILTATLQAPQKAATIHDTITIFIKGRDTPALNVPLYARVAE